MNHVLKYTLYGTVQKKKKKRKDASTRGRIYIVISGNVRERKSDKEKKRCVSVQFVNVYVKMFSKEQFFITILICQNSDSEIFNC